MPLFQVQDTNCPMFILADSYNNAVDIWQKAITDEDQEQTDEQPDCISIISEDADVLVHKKWIEDNSNDKSEHPFI